MKIALLGMYHETNTFSKVEADYAAFEIYRGQEIIEQYKDSHSTNAGFIQLGVDPDIEIVPLTFAITGPIGTITKEAFCTPNHANTSKILVRPILV